jgi:hypothetical protein
MNGSWQRANIQAAASYLRELIAAGSSDPRVRSVYEGLLEVLDPARRTARIQRESASALPAVAAAAARERRRGADRRRADRRKINLGSPTGAERRSGTERRTGGDRRGRTR